MEQIQSLWAQFGSAHPIYSHLIALGIGMAGGPKLFSMAEEKGIPWLTDWFDSHQEALLKRANLTPEQILSVRQHEVADLRRSADELESRIKAADSPKV